MTMTSKQSVHFALPVATLLLPAAIVVLGAAPARAQTPPQPASPEAAESPPGPPAPTPSPAPAPSSATASPATAGSSSAATEEPLSPSPAATDASSPPQAPRPWHEGVSEERKRKAQTLFAEARELHRGMLLAEARAKYEEALAFWDHPELRFYLGRVLKSIGLPLLAHENLRLSLRWGPGSLKPEQEQEARAALRALVEQELAVIEIRCDEPGAAVLMDGKPWFVGPGRGRRIVTPGEHVLIARKAGYFTVVKPIVALAGAEASGQLALSVDAVVTRQRWPAWIPWATLGAGAAIGAAGGALMWHAGTDHGRTDKRFRDACGPRCEPSPRDDYDGSVLENQLAIGAFIAGGATLATGTVLLFLNRPQSFRAEDRGGVKVELRPAASLDAAGLSARLVF